MDSLDHKLLAFLRVDGRAPLSKIADALGVSRGTVQNRIDRMTEAGTIQGFAVRVRDTYDADHVRALMMIEIEGRATGDVIRRLRGLPEIQTLHTTNGNWDLIAEIRTSSLAEFDRILRQVRVIEGVLNSETNLLLSTA